MESIKTAGLLLIDKPKGITSFDIIRALRRQTGVRKIGHAGTLDPMATGLMLMLFDAACKKAGQFSKLDKTYIAEATLGATTTTGDAEGDITPTPRAVPETPEASEVESALQQFKGEITQIPSKYSAIKINGQEAYKLARKGKTVEIPSRRVTIYDIQLTKYEYPTVVFEAKVSSGTYIRTLAEDIGKQLGTGAYLTALRRTEVGNYKLEQAHQLADVTNHSLSASLLRI
ncbi:MAG TPA: tRNA pseudouridine(55) synthase TruB [Candidatus Dormibacteraeota bacterium]|nr:tRNA pseudouridine(55) synthase TruB [Candidatus Dormibacteraeota bacterium]